MQLCRQWLGSMLSCRQPAVPLVMIKMTTWELSVSVLFCYPGPLLLTWINCNPIIHYKMWDEITYPFPNFNGCTVEVWEWISNIIPHFTGECDYLSMLGIKLIHVTKCAPGVSLPTGIILKTNEAVINIYVSVVYIYRLLSHLNVCHFIANVNCLFISVHNDIMMRNDENIYYHMANASHHVFGKGVWAIFSEIETSHNSDFLITYPLMAIFCFIRLCIFYHKC